MSSFPARLIGFRTHCAVRSLCVFQAQGAARALATLLAVLGFAQLSAIGCSTPAEGPNNAALCAPGLVACGGGACVSLQTDSANCGICGRAPQWLRQPRLEHDRHSTVHVRDGLDQPDAERAHDRRRALLGQDSGDLTGKAPALLANSSSQRPESLDMA